jgi:CRISPR/Cas system CSM-associated protein Csm3 (group 7 of RAMP superfamily)
MSTLAKVVQKIKIGGRLVLLSPLLIGSGTETEGRVNEVDTYVLKDKQEVPFIPGTSLAGVLRDYLYRRDQKTGELLFGKIIPQSDGSHDLQSAVAVQDIHLENTKIALRDGVGIDDFTHMAKDGCKYDYEAVERGAEGTFSMEITLREFHAQQGQAIEDAIGALLYHLESGFMLGALTAKGFGRVCIQQLKAVKYDFHEKADVIAWLLGRDSCTILKSRKEDADVSADMIIDADFALRSSLIIRDYVVDEQNNNAEDDKNKLSAIQKMSNGDYVIPGTSLKGVLRHQSAQILRRLGVVDTMLDDLMGYAEKEAKKKSRFYVEEIYINGGVKAVEQTRNRIDRFTGATIETALFTTRPIWQEKNQEATIRHFHYEIRGCKDWEAGLALFLLRDLWLGQVAIGGEKSVGRGTLQGIRADIDFKGQHYKLDKDGKVVYGDQSELGRFAAALVSLKGAEQ